METIPAKTKVVETAVTVALLSTRWRGINGNTLLEFCSERVVRLPLLSTRWRGINGNHS